MFSVDAAGERLRALRSNLASKGRGVRELLDKLEAKAATGIPLPPAGHLPLPLPSFFSSSSSSGRGGTVWRHPLAPLPSSAPSPDDSRSSLRAQLRRIGTAAGRDDNDHDEDDDEYKRRSPARWLYFRLWLAVAMRRGRSELLLRLHKRDKTCLERGWKRLHRALTLSVLQRQGMANAQTYGNNQAVYRTVICAERCMRTWRELAQSRMAVKVGRKVADLRLNRNYLRLWMKRRRDVMHSADSPSKRQGHTCPSRVTFNGALQRVISRRLVLSIEKLFLQMHMHRVRVYFYSRWRIKSCHYVVSMWQRQVQRRVWREAGLMRSDQFYRFELARRGLRKWLRTVYTTLRQRKQRAVLTSRVADGAFFRRAASASLTLWKQRSLRASKADKADRGRGGKASELRSLSNRMLTQCRRVSKMAFFGRLVGFTRRISNFRVSALHHLRRQKRRAMLSLVSRKFRALRVATSGKSEVTIARRRQKTLLRRTVAAWASRVARTERARRATRLLRSRRIRRMLRNWRRRVTRLLWGARLARWSQTHFLRKVVSRWRVRAGKWKAWKIAAISTITHSSHVYPPAPMYIMRVATMRNQSKLMVMHYFRRWQSRAAKQAALVNSQVLHSLARAARVRRNFLSHHWQVWVARRWQHAQTRGRGNNWHSNRLLTWGISHLMAPLLTRCERAARINDFRQTTWRRVRLVHTLARLRENLDRARKEREYAEGFEVSVRGKRQARTFLKLFCTRVLRVYTFRSREKLGDEQRSFWARRRVLASIRDSTLRRMKTEALVSEGLHRRYSKLLLSALLSWRYRSLSRCFNSPIAKTQFVRSKQQLALTRWRRILEKRRSLRVGCGMHRSCELDKAFGRLWRVRMRQLRLKRVTWKALKLALGAAWARLRRKQAHLAILAHQIRAWTQQADFAARRSRLRRVFAVLLNLYASMRDKTSLIMRRRRRAVTRRAFRSIFFRAAITRAMRMHQRGAARYAKHRACRAFWDHWRRDVRICANVRMRLMRQNVGVYRHAFAMLRHKVEASASARLDPVLLMAMKTGRGVSLRWALTKWSSEFVVDRWIVREERLRADQRYLRSRLRMLRRRLILHIEKDGVVLVAQGSSIPSSPASQLRSLRSSPTPTPTSTPTQAILHVDEDGPGEKIEMFSAVAPSRSAQKRLILQAWTWRNSRLQAAALSVMQEQVKRRVRSNSVKRGRLSRCLRLWTTKFERRQKVRDVMIRWQHSKDYLETAAGFQQWRYGAHLESKLAVHHSRRAKVVVESSFRQLLDIPSQCAWARSLFEKAQTFQSAGIFRRYVRRVMNYALSRVSERAELLRSDAHYLYYKKKVGILMLHLLHKKRQANIMFKKKCGSHFMTRATAHVNRRRFDRAICQVADRLSIRMALRHWRIHAAAFKRSRRAALRLRKPLLAMNRSLALEETLSAQVEQSRETMLARFAMRRIRHHKAFQRGLRAMFEMATRHLASRALKRAFKRLRRGPRRTSAFKEMNEAAAEARAHCSARRALYLLSLNVCTAWADKAKSRLFDERTRDATLIRGVVGLRRSVKSS